jgi:hypothetical protein
MGQRWHQTSMQIYIFLWKGEWESWIRYRIFHIISAVKRVEFVGNGMSYITLMSLVWYHCSECSCTNRG